MPPIDSRATPELVEKLQLLALLEVGPFHAFSFEIAAFLDGHARRAHGLRAPPPPAGLGHGPESDAHQLATCPEYAGRHGRAGWIAFSVRRVDERRTVAERQPSRQHAQHAPGRAAPHRKQVAFADAIQSRRIAGARCERRAVCRPERSGSIPTFQGAAHRVFKKWAAELGLDRDKFAECLESKRYEAAIGQSIEIGRKAGVSIAPRFFINGVPFTGAESAESLQEIIDDELAQKS